MVQSAIAATTGSVFAAVPRDQISVVVSGTYTDLTDDSQTPYPMRVKVSGLDQVRTEVDRPEGTFGTLIESGAGWQIGPNSNATFSIGEIFGKQLEVIPFLAVLDWGTATDTTVQYIELATIDGVQLLHLSISRSSSLSTTPEFQAAFQQMSTCDLFLDPQSYLPARLTYNEFPNDGRVGVPVTLLFANYQQIAGIQIPTVVTQVRYGTKVAEYDFQSVVLNAAITPSDFELR